MKGKSELLLKSTIKEIDSSLNVYKTEQVIYRVINFSNIYFFAQEISTGCIFPIYCFSHQSDKKDNKMNFKTNSYLKNGKYFIYYPTVSKKLFEYSFDEEALQEGVLEIPSVKEVNTYLKQKRKDKEWKNLLQKMEEQNKYMCDLSLIKEMIVLLTTKAKELDFNFNNVKQEYIEYIPSVDLTKIEKFGYDLSEQDNLCSLIGREEEKKKIIKAVAIRNKSVVLVGEPGSGKTAILESLALDIKNRKNPWLNDKVIFYLDTAVLVSETKYRGEFEEKFLDFIKFCIKNKDRIIIFIDEIHTLYGLGRAGESSIDAMNILKPYISKGDITIIGATTEMEYQKYMANDPAFLRRLEEVKVSVPDKNMNIQIISSYINQLQSKYNIKLDINENMMREIVDLIIEVTDPLHQKVIGINKVVNPTISKKIIEDAFAEAVYNKREVVTIDDICLALLSCDKFSPTYRKEMAEKLKNKLAVEVCFNRNKVIKFEAKTLTLIK